MMDSDCRAIIKVIGQVQGVGYRFSALQMATALKLTGYVKNLPDESVYIEAQGNADSVMEFIAWCKTGTGRARVQAVEYSFLPAIGFMNFQIR